MRRIFLLPTMAILLSTLSTQASAQVVLSPVTKGVDDPIEQTYRITVPKNITITCPDTLVEHVHDGNDTDQTFSAVQIWEVKGNSQKGVTVTFDLDSPFSIAGSTLDHQRRDASLLITPGTPQGPASWNGTAATIFTDIDNGKLADSWQSQSDGVGRSTFSLTMKFVNQLAGAGFGAYEAGTYETTVTGEVTENP
ncbi:MAG: hypothetical protein KDA80_24305 [Planctomycetaceae bacterium]|nr:hypothetical protein [Planctomycetaceae bacterium]